MNALEKPLTLEVSAPGPYIHLDNRALVLHDDRGGVVYGNAAFMWIAETLRVILEEGRATRQQGSQVFGGFVHDDTATLYAGTAYGLVTVDVTCARLRELHTKISGR